MKADENNTILESTLPSKWKFNNGSLMLAHIDPLMHLLFYGIGSSTIEELRHFLVMRERHSQFKKDSRFPNRKGQLFEDILV